MPADLRPPAQWAHLRWHWLIPHNDYDQTASREEPEVMLWCPEKSREWMHLDYWKTEVGTMAPMGAGYLGWRYHSPCLPNAWAADPDDAEQLKLIEDTIHRCVRDDPDHDPSAGTVSRRILTAMRDAAKGGQ